MLTNAELKTIRQLRNRHGRRKSGLILCEGFRACREALRQRPEWAEFLVMRESARLSPEAEDLLSLVNAAGITIRHVPDTRFKELGATENPQGVLSVLRRPPPEEPPAGPLKSTFIIILDRLADPGNAGTIARTAWAAGVPEIWVTAASTDLYAPKSIRAGMGAQFGMNIREVADIRTATEILAEHTFRRLWYSMPKNGVSCYAPEFELNKSAIVIGNEAHGTEMVPNSRLENAAVTIPMPGHAESLNAAQAAAILIFEGVRRGLILDHSKGS